jgi:hypothetical protein
MKVRSKVTVNCEIHSSVSVYPPTYNLAQNLITVFFGTLFYDAFSVTRLYSVDNRVTSK